MATNKYVRINTPESADLADLTGILHDFESTKQFTLQLEQILNQENFDHTLVEPMTTAILVRYSRPFTTGVRQRLCDKDLVSLSSEQRAAHECFRSWRNKHIAHSVNEFENNQPVTRYWVEQFDDEGFTSVECKINQLVGLSSDNVSMVIELSTHFIEQLEPRLNAEKEKILAIVQSLPREQILAMEKVVRLPSIDEVGKTRKN